MNAANLLLYLGLLNRWLKIGGNTKSKQETQHPLSNESGPVARSELVDVVICVHNALHATERCLRAVQKTTTGPYRLIVVDDGSDETTAEALRRICSELRATLIRHLSAKGYTAAANAGLRACEAPWVVLLNSDTVPTDGWIDRMWQRGAFDRRVGIIGPVSNCAAWQSVPRLTAGGDWQSSKLPPDFSIEELGQIVAALTHASVQIPFVNGFCYMIRKELIGEIGLFDETQFPQGYGEEHDFSMRAAKAGWRSIVAGSVYVFHEGSKSFGHTERKRLAIQGEQALARKHDPELLNSYSEQCRTSLAMTGIRARVDAQIEGRRLTESGQKTWKGRHIVFLCTASGEASSVLLQQARILKQMDVATTVCLVGHSAMSTDEPFLRFDDQSALHDYLRTQSYDAVVGAGLEPSTIYQGGAGLRPCVVGYYLHHAPAWVSSDRSELPDDFRLYVDSAEFRLLTQSLALRRTVEIYTGRIAQLVFPSIDPTVFYPRGDVTELRRHRGRVTIAAMLCPQEAWRESARLVAIMERAKDRFGDTIEINVFGATDEQLRERGWLASTVRSHGLLKPAEVAVILNESDIFIELTSSGAMSQTALEAMACGCAVIMNCFGGSNEYAHHLQSAWIVDGSEPADIDAAIEKLLSNHSRRAEIQRQAVSQSMQYTSQASALTFLNALFPTAS